MRPTPKRPTDYVRCGKCKRLVEKKNSTKVNGIPYGRECIKLVLNSIQEEDDVQA